MSRSLGVAAPRYGGPWRETAKRKPEPRRAVIVWDARDRNHYMAWFDRGTWWEWRAYPVGDKPLPFAPTHWRYPTAPPLEGGA